GKREAVLVADLDLDLDAAADERADQLRDVLDLRADVEHFRLERLAAGEGQKLRRQLGGALHRPGDRLDLTAAGPPGEIAAAQEIGGGTDDGQEIVEIVRDAAGELADRFHLLGLAQHFLALAAFGDVDGLQHGARYRIVLIEQGAHHEIELAVADWKMQQHVDAHFLAEQDPREGLAD